MVLLDMLRRLGYEVIAAHCNFHLRGEESMRDERFVTEQCKKQGMQLYKTDFSTETYANEHGISIEMAARDLRYSWFEELRQERECEAIAVAHHQNDQAETLLMNLMRGTGIRGLCAMHPLSGKIVRPLLCLTRKEIERYAADGGTDYVTDSTNADTAIKRNAIRAMLQSASESEIRHMAETAELMQGYKALTDALLTGQPLPEEAEQPILYEMLAPYGFNGAQVRDIQGALASSGKRFETPHFVATIDHGELRITTREQEEEQMPMLIRSVRPRLKHEQYPAAEEPRVLLDADKLGEELHLRHWKAGDSFYPITSGRPMRKKLQDFFSDMKLSLAEKDRTWLLCTGEGEREEIVWVIGRRVDNRFKLTETTGRVAEIEVG